MHRQQEHYLAEVAGAKACAYATLSLHSWAKYLGYRAWGPEAAIFICFSPALEQKYLFPSTFLNGRINLRSVMWGMMVNGLLCSLSLVSQVCSCVSGWRETHLLLLLSFAACALSIRWWGHAARGVISCTCSCQRVTVLHPLLGCVAFPLECYGTVFLYLLKFS